MATDDATTAVLICRWPLFAPDPSSCLECVTRFVQVSPWLSVTTEVLVRLPPAVSCQAKATSRAPTGGVKLAVVASLLLALALTNAGVLASASPKATAYLLQACGDLQGPDVLDHVELHAVEDAPGDGVRADRHVEDPAAVVRDAIRAAADEDLRPQAPDVAGHTATGDRAVRVVEIDRDHDGPAEVVVEAGHPRRRLDVAPGLARHQAAIGVRATVREVRFTVSPVLTVFDAARAAE